MYTDIHRLIQIKRVKNNIRAYNCNLAPPTNLKEIQVFLGLAGLYRKFMKDYAKVVVLLTDQLKAKGCDFNWGED